ncbi:MAG: tRNA (adenosine(37)-N6)-dimethylallyltransferase MiaA, partial [Epsilonproteobacteria bacterium]|nr:tRNA (adenosine(37)-N6)-dimethylallyltransferase MiaA [Campylobacterota bacterium]
MKQLAIIGSTASGKSDFALALAQKHNAIILSIDSLSIYRKIDIASAKPSQ